MGFGGRHGLTHGRHKAQGQAAGGAGGVRFACGGMLASSSRAGLCGRMDLGVCSAHAGDALLQSALQFFGWDRGGGRRRFGGVTVAGVRPGAQQQGGCQGEGIQGMGTWQARHVQLRQGVSRVFDFRRADLNPGACQPTTSGHTVWNFSPAGLSVRS